MKLDCREKYDCLKRFISQLKAAPRFVPFLMLEDTPRVGVFDFFPHRRVLPCISLIERKLKEEKYAALEHFLVDLRGVFEVVSDYVFEDDPLQEECARFLQKVERFELDFMEEFTVVAEPREVRSEHRQTKSRQRHDLGRKTRDNKEETCSKSSDECTSTHRSTMLERLQMVLHLQSHSANQIYVRSVGEQFGVGSEDKQYYYLAINNKNSSWVELLQREHY